MDRRCTGWKGALLCPRLRVIPATRPGLDQPLLLQAPGAALGRRGLETQGLGNGSGLQALVPQCDEGSLGFQLVIPFSM
jgi:hypothetical protein